MNIFAYNRVTAVNYALKYALSRNPNYYNFDNLGGNCTNFVSQSIFSGCSVMNQSPVGWYYNSLDDRSPAWTGVNQLYTFLINNKSVGPFATLSSKSTVSIGDVIQLGRSDNDFYHTMVITEIRDGRILICANTRDAKNIPLDYYSYRKIRFIHIEGYRK
jgi:hypothetical protein